MEEKRMLRPEGSENLQETLVNFILDETGSMLECKEATISGFNEYVQSLRQEVNENLIIKMSLTKFNSSKIEVVYTNKDISEVPFLNENTYIPNALTPLYDAIAKTIKYVDEELLKSKKGKRPKIVCVILTDGLENNSRECNKEKILELIKKKESEEWNFVYIGANQDAWEVGIGLGFSAGNISGYTPTDVGYVKAFHNLAVDTVSYAVGMSSKTTCFVSKDYQVKKEDEKK